MRWIADTSGGFEEQRAIAVDARHPSDPALADLFKLRTDPDLPLVDEETALYSSAVFSAVLLISETMASVPLKCYARKADDSRAPSNSPVARLFEQSPNGVVPVFHFIEALTAHACTFGQGFAEIVWGGNNFPTALWPLDPRYVDPVKKPSGQVGYVYRPPDQPLRVLEPREVLHIRGPCFDTINAYPRVRMAAKAIGLGMAAEKHAARFFSKGASSPVILEHPGQLSPAAHQRLEKSVASKRGEEGWEPWILEEGMKANVVGVDPEKSQLRETRALQVIEVARFYRVFPHLLMDLDRATFSNIEELMLAFVRLTMLSWAKRWESELNFKLLPNSSSYLEFLFEGLERGALAQRLAAYKTGREIGLYSLDDLLKKENMPTLGEAAGGQVRLYPLNHGIVGQEGKERPTQPELQPDDGGATPAPKAGAAAGEEGDDPIARSLQPFVDDAFRRLNRRHAKALDRAVKRHAGDAAGFARWAATYAEETRGMVIEALAPVMASIRALGQDAVAQDQSDEYLQSRARTLVEELRDSLGLVKSVSEARILIDELEGAAEQKARDELRYAIQALKPEENNED